MENYEAAKASFVSAGKLLEAAKAAHETKTVQFKFSADLPVTDPDLTFVSPVRFCKRRNFLQRGTLFLAAQASDEDFPEPPALKRARSNVNLNY